MLNTRQIENKYSELEKNIVFVTTIYDAFEALEETLGKLKLEKPLFLTHIAKKAFAEEVFNYAEQSNAGVDYYNFFLEVLAKLSKK